MAMTPAGQLDQRVEFQRATTARSALGGKNASAWTALGRRWAKMRWGSGAERRQAAVEQGFAAATIRVRKDSLTASVTDQDRVLHVLTGLTFDITGIVPIEAEIEFTGTASRG